MNKLDELRQQIDAIDDQLVALFLKRMDVVRQIADAKADACIAVKDSGREDAIVSRLTKDAPDKMKPYICDLYKTVFSTSKSFQSTLMKKG